MIEKILLPFATCSQENVIFDSEIEKAAVFCMAELNREKGGGFLRKQNVEKIGFITKIYYPFLVAPVRKLNLLFDGLNVASHEILCAAMPDLKAFKKSLKGRHITRQVHVDFLSNSQNYFKMGDEKKLVIEGLLCDAELTTEFLNNAKEATPKDSPVTDAVLVTPAWDQVDILKMLQTVEETRSKLTEELADLNEIIKLLNRKTKESHASLRKEIKATKKEFGKKIRKTKSALNRKVSKIKKEYSNNVTKISTRFEIKIKKAQKEIFKVKKAKEQLDAEIECVEAEIKTSAINKDDSAEQKWKKKRKELKEKHPKIAAKLWKLEKQNLELEERRKNELFQLRQNRDDKIKEVSKELVEIEASRDAEIKVFQNEMEKIEGLTSNIIKRVDELVKGREALFLEFGELGIEKQKNEFSMIYMPFYLSCYQSKSNKRYTYLAPSTIHECSLSTRLKSVGKTKISHFFKLRYRKTVPIINRFIGLLDENIEFKYEISEACMKANLLQMEGAQEAVRSGLNKLKEQSWLSNSEFELFSRAISRSFR